MASALEQYFRIIHNAQASASPLTSEHVARLAERCGIHSGTRVLDLGCGGGQLLCQWARDYDLKGTGVDEDDLLIQQALQRANDLEVWSLLNFVTADVAAYPQPFHQYQCVICLNPLTYASLPDMLTVMCEALDSARGGILLVGALYWRQVPAAMVAQSLGIDLALLPDMPALLADFDACGGELVDHLLFSVEDWDRHHASQWQAVQTWLTDNNDHDSAAAIREAWHSQRRQYLTFERDYVAWGAFVLKVPASPENAPTAELADSPDITEMTDEDTPDWL